MAHRGQWSEREARGVLSAWRKSGQSLERFAKERGLVPQRLRWWRNKLEGKRALLVRSEAPLALLPVHVTESESRSANMAGASPRQFQEWRAEPIKRDEDAAYAFGHALIEHCRDEALKVISSTATEAARASALEAVDTALHNLCDMLEGFWRLDIDPGHHIELALQVRVLNDAHQVVDTREISPGKLDLPIGYWKWARDREFR